MYRTVLKIILLAVWAYPFPLLAQHIEYGNVFTSNMENEDGNKVGKGGIQYVSGSYTLPFSTQIDSLHRIRSWSATFTGKYASLMTKYVINLSILTTSSMRE